MSPIIFQCIVENNVTIMLCLNSRGVHGSEPWTEPWEWFGNRTDFVGLGNLATKTKPSSSETIGFDSLQFQFDRIEEEICVSCFRFTYTILKYCKFCKPKQKSIQELQVNQQILHIQMYICMMYLSAYSLEGITLKWISMLSSIRSSWNCSFLPWSKSQPPRSSCSCSSSCRRRRWQSRPGAKLTRDGEGVVRSTPIEVDRGL